MVTVLFTVVPIPLFLSTIISVENHHEIHMGMMPAAFQMPHSLLVPGANPSRHYLHILNNALMDMVNGSLFPFETRPKRIIEFPPENYESSAGLFPTIELDVTPEFLKSVTDFNSYLVSSQFLKSAPPADLVLPPGVQILPLELLESSALSAFEGPLPSFGTASGSLDPMKTDYPHFVWDKSSGDTKKAYIVNSSPKFQNFPHRAEWEKYYSKLKEYNDYWNRYAKYYRTYARDLYGEGGSLEDAGTILDNSYGRLKN